LTERLLAATKFSVPALPDRYVPRQRLHAALDAAAQLPLTLVVGVPGAGKSVMLQSWLHDRPGLRSAWLSCDARDADPVTFWLAVSAALTRAWPGRWLDVTDLLTEKEPDLDDVAIAVVNDHLHQARSVVAYGGHRRSSSSWRPVTDSACPLATGLAYGSDARRCPGESPW
jgi:ATP/maltotriose-dependent transcriptional regulator MalT